MHFISAIALRGSSTIWPDATMGRLPQLVARLADSSIKVHAKWDKRPRHMKDAVIGSERIRYALSQDGTQIAWAVSGQGPTLVWAPNNYTSIVEDWANPIRAPLLRALTPHFRVVRYDHRGFGSSSRDVSDQSLTAWQSDLAAVIDAAHAQGSVAILGMSQGAAAAVAFTAEHPDRVSRLILHGSTPFGPGHARSSAVRSYYDGMVEATRGGWSSRNSSFRMWMSAGLLSDATPAEIAWFDAFFSRCAEAPDAVCFLHGWKIMDARPHLAKIAVPTLVMHNSGDELSPPSLGRQTAALIPAAVYVALDGIHHVPRPDDGTLTALISEILRFTETESVAPPRKKALTAREFGILTCLSEGKSNAAIAEYLGIAEKTVRNHLTSIYDKLGVTSRTQAVLAALGENVPR
jgi:pimeloyl-ACP methyl ester carboxylesterase/DNA-binding CsgD family transcriptional regulator